MKRQLIFVHGRSQEHKDAQGLKDEWISALRVGLAKSNKKLPIPEADVRFPYYGQALYDLVHDAPPDEVAEIIVKGSKDEARCAYTESILNEVRRKLGVTDEEVIDSAGGDVVQKGIQNKTWVLAILRAIDKHVTGGSGATIASVTNDVYQYLRNPGVRDRIDEGVRKAFSVNDANVVVSHSLGIWAMCRTRPQITMVFRGTLRMRLSPHGSTLRLPIEEQIRATLACPSSEFLRQ